MDVSIPHASTTGLTAALAAQSHAVRFEQLPEEAVRLAGQCVLDYLGVTLAGVAEPVSEMVFAEMAEQGGVPAAHVHGRGAARLPAMSAALANGTASHALDFDDVNMAMPGHPSVAILPALLALGEELHASGRAVVIAFAAGYELQCCLGRLLAPSHYDGGFHATGTIGSFGAAAACARLMDLDADRTAHALGIAATQAAGLKSMFGTMCKPLHAGKAAANGLLAARLARRGFVSRADAIEAPQGFAATHSADYRIEDAWAEPAGGYHLRNNLFKYHAACYLTHATIEATRRLRLEHGLRPEQVAAVTLRLDRSCDRVCNIPDPQTGLETKFSLRHTCAMALAGVDTAALGSYSDAGARDPTLVALREKVGTEFQTGGSNTVTAVEIRLLDGRTVAGEYDAGLAAADVAEQGRRLDAKFRALAGPLLGEDRTGRIAGLVERLQDLPDITTLAQACA